MPSSSFRFVSFTTQTPTTTGTTCYASENCHFMNV